MGQGIQDFYNTAQARGFSRDYQLRVAQIGDMFQPPNDTLFVYAKTASLPKRNIQTVAVNFKGFTFNVPMQTTYESGAWPLTIYCDSAFAIRSQVESWQKLIFDEHTMQGILENKIIQLNLLNDNTDTVVIYRLHGVIPQSIGEIQYDLSGNGKPQSFEITFAYQYWSSQNISIRNTENQDLLSRIAGSIRSIGNIGQGINEVVKDVRSFTGLLGG